MNRPHSARPSELATWNLQLGTCNWLGLELDRDRSCGQPLELRFMQPLIGGTTLQQLGVRSNLGNATVVQDHNSVRKFQRVEPVCDYKSGATANELLQGAVDEQLALRVVLT